MTLRSRVLTALAFVLVVVAAVSTFVVMAQRDQLTDQLDERLLSIVPLARPAPANASGNEAPPAPRPDAPVSEFFVARINPDGTVTDAVRGQLLSSAPDLSTIDPRAMPQREFVNLTSADGAVSFRVLLDAGPTDSVTVFAVPTTDVDETLRQLTLTFLGATLLIALALGLIAWWVVRLGIAPIVDMTNTAQAIAAGERSQRAPQLQASSEAGQLADALNDMLDQRDEADDRLRRFVSDASHELRTPLTSIRGYLEIYSSGGFREPGELDDVVRRMQDESSRMASLVENLLMLARHDEGQPLNLEVVDVAELITAVAGDFRSTRDNAEISVVLPDDHAVVAEVDRERLLQLVVGLVDNAFTHAPEAAVTITAQLDVDTLAIQVADNGPGMAEDVASRVFDRFSRGDNARTRGTGGSGLGLAIAKGIAEAHGGTLTLKTAVGTGSAFTVRVPAYPVLIEQPPSSFHG